MLKIEQVQRATSQARHDAIVSGVHVVPDFEDGSLLDLVAYEEEQAAQAEAGVRERYGRRCVEVWQ